MKKLFYVIILFSFIQLFLFFNSFSHYPPSGPYSSIKPLETVYKEYPNIKTFGFISDNDNTEYILYRIQYSIIPAFIDNSKNYKVLFCYSSSDFCNNLINENKVKLLKQYSENLFLVENLEDKW